MIILNQYHSIQKHVLIQEHGRFVVFKHILQFIKMYMKQTNIGVTSNDPKAIRSDNFKVTSTLIKIRIAFGKIGSCS